jgi:hypothetical protein
MGNHNRLFLLVLSLLLLSSCTAIRPAQGFTVLLNADRSDLVGRSTCWTYFGIFCIGDAGIASAMKDGGITRVHHVDVRTFNILNIFTEQTTIAYGDDGNGGDAAAKTPRRVSEESTSSAEPFYTRVKLAGIGPGTMALKANGVEFSCDGKTLTSYYNAIENVVASGLDISIALQGDIIRRFSFPYEYTPTAVQEVVDLINKKIDERLER